MNGIIGNSLKNSTFENRAEKLAKILTKYLGIQKIHVGTESKTVDAELTKSFLSVRNKLFHSGKFDFDLKEIVEEITAVNILVIEAIRKIA